MKNLIITGITGAIVFIFLIVLYPHILLSPGELVQGHQDIRHQCFSCHQPFAGISNDKCIVCHTLQDIGKHTQDSVAGSGAYRKQLLFHKNLGEYACMSCHTDHAGLNRASATDGFRHEILPKTVMTDCIACHQKPEDKLHPQLTDACAKCHATSAWQPEIAFNHDMVKPAERDNCAGCHETPADAFHRSIKDQCSKCHSTGHWVPATFDHASYFVLDSDHNVKCATCHLSNNYNVYTCYGCHEHTAGNILQEHREEGITNLSNCVSCHKSSSEHEGGEGRGGKERDRGDDD